KQCRCGRSRRPSHGVISPWSCASRICRTQCHGCTRRASHDEPVEHVALKLRLIGYGKMDRLVEELAPAHDCEVVGRVVVGQADWPAPADVAIDFSAAEALRGNFARYVERKLPIVIGTTGWGAHAAEFKARAEHAGLGVV